MSMTPRELARIKVEVDGDLKGGIKLGGSGGVGVPALRLFKVLTF